MFLMSAPFKMNSCYSKPPSFPEHVLVGFLADNVVIENLHT